MITHIVLFTLKSELTQNQKKEAINKITNTLAQLPKQIPLIQKYEIFTNESERKGSDIGLISTFLNIEDLNSYRNHPKHLEAVEIIKKYTEKSDFIDYSKPISYFKK
jgi:ABC-type phosphate/phosphonate transport system ATPase subunit